MQRLPTFVWFRRSFSSTRQTFQDPPGFLNRCPPRVWPAFVGRFPLAELEPSCFAGCEVAAVSSAAPPRSARGACPTDVLRFVCGCSIASTDFAGTDRLRCSTRCRESHGQGGSPRTIGARLGSRRQRHRTVTKDESRSRSASKKAAFDFGLGQPSQHVRQIGVFVHVAAKLHRDL